MSSGIIVYENKKYTWDEFCTNVCPYRIESECFTNCPYKEIDDE